MVVFQVKWHCIPNIKSEIEQHSPAFALKENNCLKCF